MMNPEIKKGGNELGELVRRLREERNLTQEQLAFKSGLKRGDIDSIERGASLNPRAPKLAQLAIGLDVPLSMLLKACGVQEKYIPKDTSRSRETLQTLLQRLILEAPDLIPVFAEHPLRARELGIEPVDHIYSGRGKGKYSLVACYAIPGDYPVEPKVHLIEKDIIIFTHDIPPQEGDFVACLHQGRMYLGAYHQRGERRWLESSNGEIVTGEYEAAGVIIEVRRKFKKGV